MMFIQITFLEINPSTKFLEQFTDECGADGSSTTQHSVGGLEEFRLHQVTVSQEVKYGRHCVEVGDLWKPANKDYSI